MNSKLYVLLDVLLVILFIQDEWMNMNNLPEREYQISLSLWRYFLFVEQSR